jgi:hypothetical protein
MKEGSFLLHNPVPKEEVVVPMTGQGDIEKGRSSEHMCLQRVP